MRVYLAGPMTGMPQFNFPTFDAAEADLLTRDYDVVPPADLHDPEVRKLALASTTGALEDLPRHLTWGQFLAQDVRMIADDGIEAIVCLDGWPRSNGARLESYVARLCKLPIYEYGPADPLTPIEQQALADVFGGVA